MRILGYLQDPILKITVFQDNGKISVKFESGLYEQTYKLREMDDIKTLDDIQKLVDEPFRDQVREELQRMNRIRNEAMQRYLPPKEEEFFEEII